MAMMILTISLLGMAGAAALAARQVLAADLKTERATARQNTLERLNALPFDSVADGSDTLGSFYLAWTVTSGGSQSKRLTLVTQGPGLAVTQGGAPPRILPVVHDTLEYRILRR